MPWPHQGARPRRIGVLRRLARRRTAVLGLLILAAFVAAGILGPLLLADDPNAADFEQVLRRPSLAHPLGTDQLGRDLLTRIVYGTRVSFLIGFLAVAISAAIGVPVGLISGYRGGVVDLLIQRVVDLLLAFPGFLLALTLIAVLGVGVTNVVVSVGLASAPVYIRLVRAVALYIKEQTYIEAARALGAAESRIVLRHVLPNSLAPVIVQSTLQLGTAILTAAGLGFLGLGVKPPTPEWGTMLGEGQTYLFSSWYIATFPGLAIFLAVMAFNLLGDGLRDALDPRLRTGA
ncbi:MAG: ABC transporter permease [Armatimonadota bacterium]|nr:ABC transporter permease [Armatimonadota bacterium]MDR7452737.1 ABC transporter permease [Armatimonadota bacterium]MDR7468279.1 ABC transporter permease [Armatimonadota bacterium]MDR7495036.1 ABC transporter permease [Armatimonadota bacterium]MDR7500472.1 ABC transporter permease [Armatimonadota bacterium]